MFQCNDCGNLYNTAIGAKLHQIDTGHTPKIVAKNGNGATHVHPCSSVAKGSGALKNAQRRVLLQALLQEAGELAEQIQFQPGEDATIQESLYRLRTEIPQLVIDADNLVSEAMLQLRCPPTAAEATTATPPQSEKEK